MRGDPLTATPFVLGDSGAPLSFDKEVVTAFNNGRELHFVADESVKKDGCTDLELMVFAVVDIKPSALMRLLPPGVRITRHMTNMQPNIQHFIMVPDRVRLYDLMEVAEGGIIWAGSTGWEIMSLRLTVDPAAGSSDTVIVNGKVVRGSVMETMVYEGW